MNANVRFEAEADEEYRAAGRWYEERRLGLGIEFFDAVDAALRTNCPVAESWSAGQTAPLRPARPAGARQAVSLPRHLPCAERSNPRAGCRARPTKARVLARSHLKTGFWQSGLSSTDSFPLAQIRSAPRIAVPVVYLPAAIR